MRHAMRPLLGIAVLATACGPAPDDIGPIGQLEQAATCPGGGDVEPPPRAFAAGIEAYASYVGQSTCSSTARPGVVAFRDLVLATYPCTSSGGIVRGCSVGGKSEHKEGRAWDWMVNVGHPAADALLEWLLRTDEHGNPHAMARRLGIMYIVWNRRMWRAYDPGWGSYSGSNPHTDHVHFSFSWAGADKETSFWTTQSCEPRCDGTKIVDERCGVGDCAKYGARCADDALGVRCVFAMCPDRGSAEICVDQKTLGRCTDGALAQTDCAAQSGTVCAAAGDSAACVSPECAGSNTILRDRDLCLPDGRIGRCDGDGRLGSTRTCPGGDRCEVYAGVAACEPPDPTQGDDQVEQGQLTGERRHAGEGVTTIHGGCQASPGRPAGWPWLLALLGGLALRGRRSRGISSTVSRGRLGRRPRPT